MSGQRDVGAGAGAAPTGAAATGGVYTPLREEPWTTRPQISVHYDSPSPSPGHGRGAVLSYPIAMAAAADGGGASHTEQPVVNFQKFCSLLQEHKHCSAHGSGRECAMLFGSTGAGKSTLLHLLAGSRFRQEAVKVADDDMFGVDIDFQLVTDQPIAGCEIGDTATSTTWLLSSYSDASTGLTFIDTPGFNNVGVDNDDVTVDAANSAGCFGCLLQTQMEHSLECPSL
jgi:hypothetical protein